MAETQNKFYSFDAGGQPFYAMLPDAGNVPSGYTPISASDFVAGANSLVSKYGTYTDPWSTNLVSTLKSQISQAQAVAPTASGAGQSGYELYQGVPVQASQVPELKAQGATVQNGNVVGAAPTIPAGSPGANLPIGQNITQGATPGSMVQNPSVGAAPQTVQTSQPNPQTVQAQPYTDPNLYKVSTQGVGPDGQPIFDVFAGDQHISDPNDPRLKGVNIPNLPVGSAPKGFQSKFQQGFNQANQTLGGQPPSSGAQANSLINQYAPPKKGDLATTFVQADPYLDSLVSAFQQYTSPQNQRASLADTYNQLVKDSGVQAIDMELVNMKNIIEGSEDDIRNEITKAGGFATDSQVLALTNARNKQLIKNYNTLLDTRNAKEKYLQTTIQLEQADRQAAEQKFNNMFDMGLQISQLQQQMSNNARQQMQWYTEQVGFDGLYDSTGGDPYYMSLVEQTLGMPKGGLVTAAQQAQVAKVRAEQERQLALQEAQLGIQKQQLGLKLTEEQIKTEQAQRAKIIADINKVGGGSFPAFDTPQGQKQMAVSKAQIDQISNIVKSGNLTTSVGTNPASRINSEFKWYNPTTWRSLYTPGATNFIADVEQVRSQLNLQSLLDAKSKGATFGALSIPELTMLANSATKLGTWAIHQDNDATKPVIGYNAKESDFKRELDNIGNFAKLDYVLRGGNPADVGIYQDNNGEWVSLNSDGTANVYDELK